MSSRIVPWCPSPSPTRLWRLDRLLWLLFPWPQGDEWHNYTWGSYNFTKRCYFLLKIPVNSTWAIQINDKSVISSQNFVRGFNFLSKIIAKSSKRWFKIVIKKVIVLTIFYSKLASKGATFCSKSTPTVPVLSKTMPKVTFPVKTLSEGSTFCPKSS